MRRSSTSNEIPYGSVARTAICDVYFEGAAVILVIGADETLLGFEILGATKMIDREILEAAAHDSRGEAR